MTLCIQPYAYYYFIIVTVRNKLIKYLRLYTKPLASRVNESWGYISPSPLHPPHPQLHHLCTLLHSTMLRPTAAKVMSLLQASAEMSPRICAVHTCMQHRSWTCTGGQSGWPHAPGGSRGGRMHRGVGLAICIAGPPRRLVARPHDTQ